MHMIELVLAGDRLVAHAEMQGHSHVSDEDLGYAVHGWLKAALLDLAPRTFRLFGRGDSRIRLLGYGPADIRSIRAHVDRFATPQAMGVCDWTASASKPIGIIEWRQGQALGFEVRVCPVVRGRKGERDAFLARLPEGDEPAAMTRVDIYREWLTTKLRNIVVIEEDTVVLRAFRLVSTWRRTPTGKVNERPGRRVILPDALIEAKCTVTDPVAFKTVLHNGLGRHRAFGFGMLLLRPG